jgi:4-amino-4-deoxy-L-arabinose transferase-like glycosyltransferase
MALGTYALISMFFQTLPPELPWQPAVSVVSGFAVLAVLGLFAKPLNAAITHLGVALDRIPEPVWLITCLAGGVLARIAVNVAFPVEWVSDPAAYWQQARGLAETGSYGSYGNRSFWPPGLPFFLYPALALFGPRTWIPLALNLVLFCGMGLIAFRLAVLALGETTAKATILILAIWPNLVFLAGGPQKELLVAFLLPAAILAYIEAARGRGRRGLSLLVLSGLCLGYSGLTQPATLLFGVVLLGYEIFARAPGREALVRLGVAGLIAVMTVVPWTLRNYLIHDAFIPVNTAGGIVFYSANNPNATGGWIQDDAYLDEAFQDAGELEANRLGFERGMDWIIANKSGFAKLAVIKQTRFLCCDGFAAFYLFLHPKRQAAPYPALGSLAVGLSNGFWLTLWLAILVGGIRPRGADAWRSPEVLILPLAVLYFLLILSVFQSEGKHHANLAGVIAIMAASAVTCAPKARRMLS